MRVLPPSIALSALPALSALSVLFAWATALPAAAAHHHGAGAHEHALAADHAPIGVMGDHAHRSGELMLSWRSHFMSMQGNRDGSSRVSTAELLEAYTVAPLKMDMEMHMLGLMYAPNQRVTLMAMLPWMSKTMELRHKTMGDFRTRSEGIGDLRLGLLREFSPGHLFSLSVSLPTGAIDRRDATPMSDSSKLAYAMQLGSGTMDLIPTFTLKRESGELGLGAQLAGTFRLGRNDQGYSLGDRTGLSLWAQRNCGPNLSASLRLVGSTWSDIDGRDTELMPSMSPAADPGLRAGETVELAAGVNLMDAVGRSGPGSGHRLAIEVSLPLYRRLDGPQLETDWRMTLGWQYLL